MDKSYFSIDFQLKDIFPFFLLPFFFLLLFYAYFYLVSGEIYGYFNFSRIETLMYLPIIYKWSYFSYVMLSLFFGIVKVHKNTFTILFPVFVVLFVTIYIIQYYSLFLTNRYLMPEAFLHIDQFFLIAGPRLTTITIVISIFVSFFGYLYWITMTRFNNVSETAGKYQITTIQTVLTIFIFVILCIPGWTNAASIDKTKSFGLPAASPGIAFASTVKEFISQSQDHTAFTLPVDLRSYIFRHYGITYNPSNEYPLVKDWIYKAPLPFQQAEKKRQKPNVIIFFMESLSANLVGTYNNQMHTPNIDNFAEDSTIIDGYYNHTFPTISGIRGQLCSFYPILGENEHADQEATTIKLFCLPHVLNRYDYSTYFFYYHAPMYKIRANTPTINIKKLLEACGFSRVFVASDIKKRLTGLDTRSGHSLINDKGMMVDLVDFLKGYENKKAPFFIALSTIGTHPKLDDNKEKILESVHKLDDAFGIFWEYFKTSPFYDNTIVVITADHTIPPTVEYRKLVGSKSPSASFFDKITLILFDKQHILPRRLQVNASSIDLAPSVLQLLEVNNISNPFQGLSIFSDRKEHPYLLCTMMEGYYVYNAQGIHFNPSSNGDGPYDSYSNISTDIFHDKNKQEAGMALWFAYNKMLNNNNKIWNGIFEQPRHQ